MFTAKILSREEYANGSKIIVEFSDGQKKVTESCVPQNREGFDHWVKSRLETMNATITLMEELPDGTVLDYSEEEVVVEPVDEEQAAWFRKYYNFIRIKANLVDTGIIPATNPKFVKLKSDVQAGLKEAYLDLI